METTDSTEVTVDYLYKVSQLAGKNSIVKNLLSATGGSYEKLSPKFKRLIDNIIKEKETKDGETTRDNT